MSQTLVNAPATKLHPGVVALDERIRVLRQSIQSSRGSTTFDDLEADLLVEIQTLTDRLATVRRQREGAQAAIVNRRSELVELEALREKSIADDRVATAVWIRLLEKRKIR